MARWLIASLVPLALIATTIAVPPGAETAPKAPNVDADQAANRAQIADGLKATVWASEPIMANPVSFAFDEQGAAYVVETNRFKTGVPDTRDHMYWLDEDIGARTVADRLAMYKKHNYYKFEKYDDQVRKVWCSTTGGKKADTSTIFTKGYTRPEDGLAAGVLARKGSVYLTNIPDLYLLKDTKGEGVADVKQSLATGFGVRAQFLGHDMHGLRMGPDGRLYFSIGDRGFNVVNKEGKKLVNTESGAVLRCEPDGSNMEIVHIGLRNPQELAFDDHGNLFTYDNNSDSGDRARWVHIVPGGDSGWRCGYQYGTLMHNSTVSQGNRGPWNLEKIWHVPGPDGGPPAYVVPALKNFGNGPSGITHYPGIGLNDKYKDHFFACDFTSNPGGSVIWDVSMKPKGASFELDEPKPFVRNMVPTDCEFGPDGAFYWSDWVGGWNPPGKGRIFRVEDPEAMKNPAVAEAKQLIAEGLEKKSVEELAKLLGHPHQQVRLEAQYELAGRKRETVSLVLLKVAKQAEQPLARLHAVWALGQLSRKEPLLDNNWSQFDYKNEADPAIRAALATIIGDQIAAAKVVKAIDNDTSMLHVTLGRMMADRDPSVRAHAAFAYAHGYYLDSVRRPVDEQWKYSPPFYLLRTNNDQDVYVRQAAVTALVGITQNPDDLFNAWKLAGDENNTPAVRMGVVLALRKLRGAKLGEFLNDADPKIVAEAARAIYDQELMDPMPVLAKLAEKPGLADVVAYRAIAANYKLGTADDAKRLAEFAARSGEQDYLRKFALELLASWPNPPKRDPITGLIGDVVLAERSPLVAAEAVKPVLAKLFAGSNLVREQAVKTTSKLNVTDVGPLMAGLIVDGKQSTSVRVEALYALDALKAKELKEATTAALASDQPKLRAAARIVTAKANPTLAMKELPELLDAEKASIEEKQAALEALGSLKESKEADAAIAAWLDKYAAGTVPAELKLDVLEAAQTRATAKNLKLFAPLREKLKVVDTAARAAEKADPLARYRESLAGGDAEKGRSIFLNNAAVYCQRCHKLDGQGGDVGPVVNGIAAKQTRDYLLEAVVYPSAKIAEGYQSVILTLLDGRTVSGVLRAKDAKNYTLVTSENKVLTIAKDDVDGEKPDKSAMPEDLIKKISKRELRDLIEFLAGLKELPKKEGGAK